MAKLGAFKSGGTTAIAAVVASSVPAQLPAGGETVRVFNPTNGILFVRFGLDNTVVAAATDFPVPAGGDRLMDVSGLPSPAWIAVFLATGATGGTVFVSRGDGSSQ
jgi:hypothetical protein